MIDLLAFTYHWLSFTGEYVINRKYNWYKQCRCSLLGFNIINYYYCITVHARCIHLSKFSIFNDCTAKTAIASTDYNHHLLMVNIMSPQNVVLVARMHVVGMYLPTSSYLYCFITIFGAFHLFLLAWTKPRTHRYLHTSANIYFAIIGSKVATAIVSTLHELLIVSSSLRHNSLGKRWRCLAVLNTIYTS